MMPFVGRGREVAVLRAALADAVGGRARLVLLAGEPGIGKTRMGEEVAALARQENMQVFWGRCYEGEGAPAFWPWVQVLRAASKSLSDKALRGALGWGGAEVAQIAPELRHRLPDLGVSTALDSAQARFRLFESVAHFLENLSRIAPLVCIIDDLHGGDRPSLLLLEFVARELRDVPALLVGTYRHGATLVGHPLTELVVEVLRLPDAHRLTLSGLSPGEVGELVERTMGVRAAPALVAAMHRQTEGNPLYIGEYLRLLLGRHAPSELGDPEVLRALPVPESVRAIVRHRIAPLSSRCRLMLDVAAVIGREFHRDVVEAVMAADSDAASATGVFAVLDEAAAAGIIGEELEHGGRYRFAHAVLREALYEDVGAGRRLQLHRRVGEALEQRRDEQEHLAELAYHFHQAAMGTAPAGAEADTAKAVAYARRAGDGAMKALAYEEAVRLYQLAIAARDHRGVRDDAERRALVAELDAARNAAQRVSAASAGLVACLPGEAVFRREGDYWTIAYAGQVVRLKDGKGVQYLAHLLRHSGQELLALDLIQGADVRAQGSDNNEKPETRDQGLPSLDAQSKSEYRQRLRELRAELAEAEQFNDLGRVEKLKDEIDFLVRQLNAAVDLYGKDRKAGAAAERARLMVTKRIKSVLNAFDTLHPALAHHLRACVKTGYYCAYTPPPGESIVWQT